MMTITPSDLLLHSVAAVAVTGGIEQLYLHFLKYEQIGKTKVEFKGLWTVAFYCFIIASWLFSFISVVSQSKIILNIGLVLTGFGIVVVFVDVLLLGVGYRKIVP